MTSTTTSDPILSVRDLHLSFDLQYQKGHSLRDLFVNVLSSPMRALFDRTQIHPVLENINFDLHKGQKLALIGVNGSGKTSLCRAIAGMISPQQGSIKRIGDIQAVFSTSSAIHYTLTGRENAYLLGELIFPSLSRSDLKAAIEEALEFSELGKFLDAPFYTYSRGMQARLFLSVVTASSTELLILDEVYDGADEFFQIKMADRMDQVIKNSGAVIFISHNSDLLKQVCNRAIVLNQGHILFDSENMTKAISIYKSLHSGGELTNSQ